MKPNLNDERSNDVEGEQRTQVATMSDVAQTASMPAPYDFAPTNFREAIDLAKMLSESTIVPKGYSGKPGDCFIAMQMGHEIGLPPVQSLQSIAVINGKPSIYGDAGKALLLRAGCRIDEFDIAEIKAGGFAQCTIVRPDGRRVTRTFSLDDAKTAGLLSKDGPWKQYPQRQMAWRAFWFAARDGAADILKGLQGAEEMRDITDEAEVIERKTPPGPQSKAEAKAAPKPPAAKQAPADVDTMTGEVRPTEKTAGEQTTAGTEGDLPASAGMVAHIRKRLENATLTEAECIKKFKIERLDGITVAQANAIIAWTANPTG